MEKIKVRFLTSNSGHTMPNQYVISTPEGEYFQSFLRIIAFKPIDAEWAVLDKKWWDHSTIARRYRNMFLGESIVETREKIASGRYLLEDLN